MIHRILQTAAFPLGWIACNASHGEWQLVLADITVAIPMLAWLVVRRP